MQEVLEVLVCALVDHPEEVEIVEEARDGHTVRLKVWVAPGDMGKVIGRGGRIANAIRTVTSAAATRENVRVFVDFES